jgi:hypothetical protein
MQLNDAGCMVRDVWDAIPTRYPGVRTDAFVILPNHVRGTILLTGTIVGAAPRGRPNTATPRGRPSPPPWPPGCGDTPWSSKYPDPL